MSGQIKIIVINPALEHVSERFIEPTQEAFASALTADSYCGETSRWDEVTGILPGEEEARYNDNGGEGALRFRLGVGNKSEMMSGLIGIHGGYDEENEDEDGEYMLLPTTLTPKDLTAKIEWCN